MHQGETVALPFTFAAGLSPSDYDTFKFYAWVNPSSTRWGLEGADGDAGFAAAGQILTVELSSALTAALTLTAPTTVYAFDLRGIDSGGDQVVLARGTLSLHASPSLA